MDKYIKFLIAGNAKKLDKQPVWTYLYRVKKLLIVTYYWPPAGGPGVQRWVKLTKYLNKLGYQCRIVTVDERYASYPSIDLSLQKDTDVSIHVTKTKSFEVLKIFSSLFRKEKVPYAGIPDKNKMSLVGRMALYIRSNFFIPDARVGWNKYAIEACEEIIRKENIDVLITTSPPHSTQLIGLALKKKFKNIKWIADLRDPWTDIYYYEKLSHTKKAKQKDLGLEKQVLEQADAVSVTSPLTEKLYASKIDKAYGTKIKTITNGFDEDDFRNATISSTDTFTITFAGTINEQFAIEGFVQAVKKITGQHKNVLLHFIGTLDNYTKQLLEKEIPQHHKITAYVPHKELMNYLMQSHVLLLSIPKGNNQGTIPGKLFEYLATQKAIICLGPQGCSAGEIINECQAGKTFPHEAVNDIKNYLQQLVQGFEAGKNISVESTVYKKYARQELAKQYADLIKCL
jgi:glycosyltransferase involved in cell wall biosynthesis